MAHDTTKSNTDFISYTLAKWAHGLTFESLSPEAVRCAKLFLFDSFAQPGQLLQRVIS